MSYTNQRLILTKLKKITHTTRYSMARTIYSGLHYSGCDNSRFSAVPDAYSDNYCRIPLKLVQTLDPRCT